MKKHLLIGGAIAVLGAGIWIGRATQSKAELPAPQAELMGTVADGVTRELAFTAKPPVLQRAQVAPDLAADLKDPDPKVRSIALRDALKDGASAEVFRTAVRDRDLAVGMAAANGLAKAHARGEITTQELVAIVTDKSLQEKVRVEAINGLAAPSADAARALVDLVHRGDTVEKRSAAILLMQQDSEVAVPALIDALGDSDERVRANAAEALRRKARGRDFGTDAGAWRAWWQSRSR
jgi:HEAT repeat protein